MPIKFPSLLYVTIDRLEDGDYFIAHAPKDLDRLPPAPGEPAAPFAVYRLTQKGTIRAETQIKVKSA